MKKSVTTSLVLFQLYSYSAFASLQFTEAFQYKCSTGHEVEFAVHYAGSGGSSSAWGYQSICPKGTLSKGYYSYHPILERLFGAEMPADLKSCQDKMDSVPKQCKEELSEIIGPPGKGDFPARSKFTPVGERGPVTEQGNRDLKTYVSCSCETADTGVREFYDRAGYVCHQQLLKTTGIVYALKPQQTLSDDHVAHLCARARDRHAEKERKRISEIGRRFKAETNPCTQSEAVEEVDSGVATPYQCARFVVEEHEVNARREILKSRILKTVNLSRSEATQQRERPTDTGFLRDARAR